MAANASLKGLQTMAEVRPHWGGFKGVLLILPFVAALLPSINLIALFPCAFYHLRIGVRGLHVYFGSSGLCYTAADELLWWPENYRSFAHVNECCSCEVTSLFSTPISCWATRWKAAVITFFSWATETGGIPVLCFQSPPDLKNVGPSTVLMCAKTPWLGLEYYHALHHTTHMQQHLSRLSDVAVSWDFK